MDELSRLRERVAELENELALSRLQADANGSQMLDLQRDCIGVRKELTDLRADYVVHGMAVEIEREQRKTAFDQIARIEDVLTDCGYTDKQARVAAISVLAPHPALPPSEKEK